MSSKLEPAMWLLWYWSTLIWQLSSDHKMDLYYQIAKMESATQAACRSWSNGRFIARLSRSYVRAHEPLAADVDDYEKMNEWVL